MGKQRHWVTQARHILTSHLTLPRVGRVLAILVTPPIKAMTDKTVVVTLALMVSVVLMVVGRGEPALTTPGLLAVILLGTRGTMPATPTHSRQTTSIRGTEIQPLPTILLTHRTIPTVLNPELQVPHLTSQHRSHPHPFPNTATHRIVASPPARLSHPMTRPQCQHLGTVPCPQQAWGLVPVWLGDRACLVRAR